MGTINLDPPCKNCISLAMCMNKNPLRCEILFDYMDFGKCTEYYLSGYANRRLNKYTGQFIDIRSIFGKTIQDAYTIDNKEVCIYWKIKNK